MPARLPRPPCTLVHPAAADWHDAPGFALVDPATEATVGEIPVCDATTVEAAVRRAAALSRQLALGERGLDPLAILEALIGEIAARHDAFAEAIAREMGAPLDFSRDKQVGTALSHLRTILKAARESAAELATPPGQDSHFVRYEPLGVAALITPWNWPLNQVALKVGAALAAGCTMILKPSEHATRSALLFAECMEAAGAPEGLFALLPGDGTTGAALAAHPGVDVISFTGSTGVGRAIASAAGANLTPCLLELGGKSANILFADCDVPTAVAQGVAHCFRNAGQSCNAASRMLVAREIYQEVCARAAAEAETYRFDAPLKPGSHQGPLVNRAQFDHVQAVIRRAQAEGARLLTGGPGRADGKDIGFYPRPTVFADVTPAMALFHEEAFGPVLAITPFDSEAEAVALANESAYGLAGYIQTADRARAMRVARRLAVGMVQVNGRSRIEGAPFGGRKASGYGREAGLWGIRAFQAVKSISGI
ncbi:3-succinoylsemialdehyde-pyridine dehydrogenase [Pseudoruegeria aquimaris]|uniref:aldehyde dehydrogenase (NAD(+)) n=1 Tax=Pseudoruegeria aquimaris TaxID=393663 RepID=A0A1Y5TG40_9RHOB|nr:aldehyde dehydrogenase family protein [Pseudoruegeria aquimaris]SLN59617.1 3-succinoylsemialdehyde-pyridine dehydrogenase [Pseudoruegeria aquimaris]